jgi:LysR family transcriptional regulator, transcriptional activator for aaeXAB operon
MIQDITYELSVLSKAVHHKNLSAAAVHVGLSQPQLSRLVTKIEQKLNIILLDRSARRKSGWTPIAQDLAITFEKGLSRLEAEITSIAQEIDIRELRVGSLEGLSIIASQFAKNCFQKLDFKLIYVDILDFKDLDAQFMSNNLDLIFTVKPPGKQKYNHILEVGSQQMERISTDKNTLVMSPFDLVSMTKKDLEDKKTLVSNSLSLREYWLKTIGGSGNLPVETKTGRGKGQFTIYLLGNDLISPQLWDKIVALF